MSACNSRAEKPPQKTLDRLRRDIDEGTHQVSAKLKIQKLKNINFYDIKGLRIVKTFVVFHSSDDRDRILDSYAKVF